MNVYRNVCSDSIEITNYKIDVKLKRRELPTLHVRNWAEADLPAQPAQHSYSAGARRRDVAGRCHSQCGNPTEIVFSEGGALKSRDLCPAQRHPQTSVSPAAATALRVLSRGSSSM